MHGKKRSRAGTFVALLIGIVAVVAVAWYWETIFYTARLRTWDKEAPGRVVSQFLQAGVKGNEAEAARYLDAPELKPLTRNGKWVGYQMVSIAATLEYLFTDLAPADPIRPTVTEFVFRGDGFALVKVPNAKGQEVTYRLDMIGNTWKVTEIRGARIAS